MCQVSGNPRPSVEWTRLGGDINGVDDVKHSLTNMVWLTQMIEFTSDDVSGECAHPARGHQGRQWGLHVPGS